MIKTPLEYHDRTSYRRDRLEGHGLDWPNQPRLVKEYRGLKKILLPDYKSFNNIPLTSVLKMDAQEPFSGKIDINTLSAILRLTYSATARAKFPRGEYLYRSAASAGALYPVEIYIMTRRTKGIEDGVFYLNPERHFLSQLRKGDFSLHAGGINVPPLEYVPSVSFILSAVFFRSSWKYRDRAYRYNLLDAGHVLENLFLALKALRLPFDTGLDFDDDRLNQLIGIDGYREAALVMVNITGMNVAHYITGQEIEPLSAEIAGFSKMSNNDIDYPVIREMHDAGISFTGRKGPGFDTEMKVYKTDSWNRIESNEAQKGMPYPQCVFSRRSKRNFIKREIERQDFMCILDILSGSHENNSTERICSGLFETAFFAQNVEGINPGLYSLDTKERKYGIIKQGAFEEQTAHICLDQEWLKNSGLSMLFIGNLEQLKRAYGPRGYRYAMINAGRIGERLYIAATSLGLGCCGIGAFYDDEARELLNLDENTRLLYLVAVGKIKTGECK